MDEVKFTTLPRDRNEGSCDSFSIEMPVLLLKGSSDGPVNHTCAHECMARAFIAKFEYLPIGMGTSFYFTRYQHHWGRTAHCFQCFTCGI